MNTIAPSPDVSIVICNWNGCGILHDAVRSVYEKTSGITFEIIVVDDASPDDSVAMVHKEFPTVRLVINEKNVGFVKSNNLAIPYTNGRYVLLLNSDIVLVNNAVAILARFLDDHPDVGVCGGLLLNEGFAPQVSYGSDPSFHQAVVDAFFLNDLFPGASFPKRGTVPRLFAHGPVDVDYISGADLMIRKSLIDNFGLFDEIFREYCEEADLCLRIRSTAGKRVMFVPEARIIHLGGMSYGAFGEGHIRKQYVSYAKFLTKHHGPAYSFLTRVLYAWHHFVKMLARFAVALFLHGQARDQKRSMARKAWYIVKYSIVPQADPQ